MAMKYFNGRLDFINAWFKVKKDIGKGFWGETFVDEPYQISIIKNNFLDWFNSLVDKLDVYEPQEAIEISVPKGNGKTRPGKVLSIEDQMIYSALIWDGIHEIRKTLKWSARTKRYSNILVNYKYTGSWTVFYMKSWKLFYNESLKLAGEYEYILFTDIEGFYENINTDTLISELKEIGFKKDTLELLKRSLYKWSGSVNRGLTQGYMPSNILAEIYLNSIDKELDKKGIKHIRNVDDFRIACKSKSEASETLSILRKLCLEKGLKLKDSKTFILRKNDALNKIKGISPIIEGIDGRIKEKLVDIGSGYRGIKNPIKDDLSQKELWETFKDFFIDNSQFDRSLFHYMANRIHEPHLVEYCQFLITERPEETRYIFIHFDNLLKEGYDLTDVAENLAFILLTDVPDIKVYEYQKYLFVKWICENKIVSQDLLNIVRHLLPQKFKIKNIKNYAIAYLGDNGEQNDILHLKDMQKQIDDPFTVELISYVTKSSMRRVENRSRGSVSGVSK